MAKDDDANSAGSFGITCSKFDSGSGHPMSPSTAVKLVYTSSRVNADLKILELKAPMKKHATD